MWKFDFSTICTVLLFHDMGVVEPFETITVFNGFTQKMHLIILSNIKCACTEAWTAQYVPTGEAASLPTLYNHHVIWHLRGVTLSRRHPCRPVRSCYGRSSMDHWLHFFSSWPLRGSRDKIKCVKKKKYLQFSIFSDLQFFYVWSINNSPLTLLGLSLYCLYLWWLLSLCARVFVYWGNYFLLNSAWKKCWQYESINSF